MPVGANLPLLGTVVTTAAIDSINPCAIGVLILLISVLVSRKNKKDMLIIGSLYILAILVTYIVAGIGLVYILEYVPLYISEYISIVIGIILVGAGLIEIKDYFWYGKGISLAIPANRAKKIHHMTENVSAAGAIALGVFVAAVELPCTGAPYLAIILILAQDFNFLAFMYLILYNIIFVLPLIIILVLAFAGVNLAHIQKWKMKNRAGMRLAIGLMLVLLGWLLMLIANGTINFG